MSILLVSHDLYFVLAKSHKIICLNKNIYYKGSPKNIFKHTLYTDLFNLKNYLKTHSYKHNLDNNAKDVIL